MKKDGEHHTGWAHDAAANTPLAGTGSDLPAESACDDMAGETGFLLDAHCHLGFMEDPVGIAAAADRLGIAAWCATVEPTEYERLSEELAQAPNVQVGLGLHPWWVSAAADEGTLDRQLDRFAANLPRTRLVSEVGVDLSRAYAHTEDTQLRAFEKVLRLAATPQPHRVVSIHCVKAYEPVLNLLEHTGAAETCTCVFHWFSGSFPQLQKALDLGCKFSIGKRMLATKRGRAYADVIPASRLLLETDAPPVRQTPGSEERVLYSADEWRANLDAVYGHLQKER